MKNEVREIKTFSGSQQMTNDIKLTVNPFLLKPAKNGDFSGSLLALNFGMKHEGLIISNRICKDAKK